MATFADTMKILIKNLEALPEAADRFIEVLGDRRVVAFHGGMGAGKTTFISALCRRLGVGDTAASPSFAIINEYVARPSGDLIYHFDFYRFESPEEALEIGAEDYFYSDNLCLIEWPERVDALLPPDCVDVTIEVDELTGERTLTIPEP